MAMFKQLGLIGCGLMGGSFALALKEAGLVDRVIGYSKSPSTTETARKLGVIDVIAESALLAVAEQVASHGQKGAVYIDTSTVSPAARRRRRSRP